MKKFTALLLTAFMPVYLAACGSSAPQTPPAQDAVPSCSTPVQASQSIAAASVPAVPMPEMPGTQFNEVWALLTGYWNAAEGHFACIDAMDSHTAVFSAGIWETSSGRDGTVTEYSFGRENKLTLSVLYPATAATEMDDAQPETTQTVTIDYSGLEQDGKIRIKTGENEWRQYMFAGQSAEEAYQTYTENTRPG